jgi:hypothetical protein
MLSHAVRAGSVAGNSSARIVLGELFLYVDADGACYVECDCEQQWGRDEYELDELHEWVGH